MKTLAILLLSLMAVSLHAADRTTPREIQTPYPTLTNLAVEWQIDGEGIQITGSGNVIRHNRVSGFRDCLSHMEDDGAAPQMCNDWLNNDISVGLDDGIEADFAMSDCRVIRNRITNCFVGISSQPGLGGPNYFIRNVMFNLTYSAFKLHRHSMGDVILHNTIVKSGDGFGNYTSGEIIQIYNQAFIDTRQQAKIDSSLNTSRGVNRDGSSSDSSSLTVNTYNTDGKLVRVVGSGTQTSNDGFGNITNGITAQEYDDEILENTGQARVKFQTSRSLTNNRDGSTCLLYTSPSPRD